jgi:hypothetical protein
VKAFSLRLAYWMITVRPLMKKDSPPNQKQPSAQADQSQKKGGRPVEKDWKGVWRDLFGIDSRSLAVFRMMMGALLLADLAVRATDLKRMYTDDGMFSRAEMCHRFTTIWNWSFHFGSGGWEYQAMLFCVAAGLALALLIGFESRLVAIGSWLMLVSLQHRAPPILSGADILLRMLLFWAIFLPLGREWSLDKWLEKRNGKLSNADDQSRVLSVASGALLIQMAIMYLFSAIFKSNVNWAHGEVIKGTLAHSFYAKPLGAYFLKFPFLLTWMTWSTFLLEWAAPFLLFFPRFTARVRLGILGTLAALHVGIGLCLEVDLFSLVALAGLIPFLPTEFWKSGLFARLSKPSEEGKPAMDPKPGIEKERSAFFYIGQAICLVLLINVIVININTLPHGSQGMPPPAKGGFLRTACGLGQKWNMFEETPSKDGWYVARAKLKNDSEIDLLRRGAEVNWNKPAFPASLYPNYRWRKIFREMAYEDDLGYQVFRKPVADFLYRDWNARHPGEKQIVELDFIYCVGTEAKSMDISAMHITTRERLLHLDFRDSEDAAMAVKASGRSL